MKISIVCIVIQMVLLAVHGFCLAKVTERVKQWKELREEAWKLYEEAYKKEADWMDIILRKMNKNEKN